MTDFVKLPLSGLETPLSEMEVAIQDNVHRFAVDVMRPLAAVLDAMTAEQVIAPESPLCPTARSRPHRHSASRGFRPSASSCCRSASGASCRP